jgi:hypothetical protein
VSLPSKAIIYQQGSNSRTFFYLHQKALCRKGVEKGRVELELEYDTFLKPPYELPDVLEITNRTLSDQPTIF